MTNRPTDPDPGSIGALMGECKSSVTSRINKINRSPDNKIWQCNYYEHVVRDNPAWRGGVSFG